MNRLLRGALNSDTNSKPLNDVNALNDVKPSSSGHAGVGVGQREQVKQDMNAIIRNIGRGLSNT